MRTCQFVVRVEDGRKCVSYQAIERLITSAMAVLAHTVPFAGIPHHQGLDADVLQRNEELY
jgi:hypothetical protein